MSRQQRHKQEISWTWWSRLFVSSFEVDRAYLRHGSLHSDQGLGSWKHLIESSLRVVGTIKTMLLSNHAISIHPAVMLEHHILSKAHDKSRINPDVIIRIQSTKDFQESSVLSSQVTYWTQLLILTYSTKCPTSSRILLHFMYPEQ